MLSVVLILPDAVREAGNALAEAMGWGPGNYSVPLSADGSLPATHWGLHTWAEPSFVAMLQAAETGAMPQELADGGFPPAVFQAVITSLIASVQADVSQHFATALGTSGFQVCAEPVL